MPSLPGLNPELPPVDPPTEMPPPPTLKRGRNRNRHSQQSTEKKLKSTFTAVNSKNSKIYICNL